MASVCFYFQVHQPYRLCRYSVFDTAPTYFDGERDAQLMARIAETSYLPATRLLLDLIDKYDGRFRVTFSLSGSVIELFKRYCPQMMGLLQKLAATGCVEFLGETYYHSLAFLYSRDEFKAQIELHTQLINKLFGQTPRVFRHTEMIYSNDLAVYLNSLGRYHGMLVEAVDPILGYRSPNYLYCPPGVPSVKLLLANHRLGDDIALRFSNTCWTEYPLTPDKFARWISQINGDGYVCNLLMEYEVFGHHQPAQTGIFDFLAELPDAMWAAGDNEFRTASQCIEAYDSVGEYDVPHMISWADTQRDVSPWLGNAMQSNALHELYNLEAAVKRADDPQLLVDWRRLTASDHFYFMSTQYFADGDAYRYFNPYESPYDGYINFMNVLDNLRSRADRTASAGKTIGSSAVHR